MGIDSSIALRGKPNVELLNPMDVAVQGMNMRRLSQENEARDASLAKAQNMKSLYAKNVVTDANGKKTLNQEGVMSGILEVAPEDHAEYEKRFQSQKLDQLKLHSEQQSAIAHSIVDEPSYYNARSEALKLGLPNADKLPEQFPGMQFVDKMKQSTLSIKEQIDNAYRNRELESRSADRKEARDERRFQSGIKMDEKRQGLKTPYGLANTEDDAKQLKSAHEEKLNFDNKLNQMIKLREEFGGESVDREAVARGKQLSNDLLLSYKNMAKLGVLSQADEAIINSIIPKDPLQYNSPMAAVQGQDPILAKLKGFQSDSNKDFENRIATRTRAGIDTAAQPKTKEDAINLPPPVEGTVRMKAPNGKIKDVPVSQVREAIAAGGSKI